jgi:rRNA maturation RNase YbeY
MPQKKIHFFSESVSFTLRNKTLIRNWIGRCVKNYGYTIESLNFIFCLDRHLLMLNKKYLKHNYYTDVITFDNRSLLEALPSGRHGRQEIPTMATPSGIIYADIYISIERVKKNATDYKQTFSKELKRVMIHGVLHLMGFDDKTKKKKARMRMEEDKWLRRS